MKLSCFASVSRILTIYFSAFWIFLGGMFYEDCRIGKIMEESKMAPSDMKAFLVTTVYLVLIFFCGYFWNKRSKGGE